MSSIRCLFLVQGEGRGHMTQALALQALLRQAGHEVCSVLVGRSKHRTVPSFFMQKMDAPITFLDSPNFVQDRRSQGIRPFASLLQAAWHGPRFRQSLQHIDQHIKRFQPDVVVNFFEPLAGLYYALYKPVTPMVCIAHQYLFLHPAYRFPSGHALQRQALQHFTRLTAMGASRKLALSFYPLPNLPETQLTVAPPLLRQKLFQQPSGLQEPFFLAYLLNPGYADELIRWHVRHPERPLHCFWDNQDAAPVEQFDDTLTFHRLDDEKFLALMARCAGLLTTAGFESVSEAMYLGKPVLAVPVEGHFEQYCNALDAEAAGAGMYSPHFAIDRFVDFLPAYWNPAARFRHWLAEGENLFVEEIEACIERDHIVIPIPHVELAAA